MIWNGFLSEDEPVNGMQTPRLRIVIIAGPTAAGKTETAISLARRFDGEIINADSMQVYRFMDIGTAKPNRSVRKEIPHHLIDIVDPDEEYNAAMFADAADEIIRRIRDAGHTVIVVGGTGLYIRSLLYGLLDTPSADEELRRYYDEAANRHGNEYLFNELSRRDPLSAGRIHPKDRVRIIRALEVMEKTGVSITEIQSRHSRKVRRYDAFSVVLCPERTELYDRIDRRTDIMMDEGLVAEVENLLERGYNASLKPMQSMSYKHAVAYLTGAADHVEATRRIKRDTRNYAKRQITWFKKEKHMRWYNPREQADLLDDVEKFLGRS